jgi:hypothetical protein
MPNRGDIRTDGKRFWSYYRGYKEYWVFPYQFDLLQEKVRGYASKYRKKYPAKITAYNKTAHIQNRDAILSNKRKKYQRKPYDPKKRAIYNMHAAIRRTLEHVKLTREQRKLARVIFEQARRCEKCLRIPFEVDHWIPVRQGGKSHPGNLVAMPKALNRLKSKWRANQLPKDRVWILEIFPHMKHFS